MFRGALHVHSTYSDGELTLKELRDVLSSDGCVFACVADHAEWLDESRLEQYVRDCRELSNDRFTFVAGLEYECEHRLHIVGYGAQRLLPGKDPVAVIDDLERAGAVAVIAHPATALFPWIEGFECLPSGLEVWNTKYDGRYAPRAETFALLHRLRERRSDMRAFFGQDLHWRHQYRGLQVDVDCQRNSSPEILTALRSGAFAGITRDLHLSATASAPTEQLASFARLHRRSDRLRRIVAAAKRRADDLGVSVPSSLKSQVRRIF